MNPASNSPRPSLFNLAMAGLLLSACQATHRPIPHAPPEQAAQVVFPPLPNAQSKRLPGNMAASIQLAMEDFLPWGAPSAPAPIPQAPCLSHRESYEVVAVPLPEGVMLVRFELDPKACALTENVFDVTTYAIDVRTMRILSRETVTRPVP
ncbi:hypothetical protein SAMN05443639_106239 [Stigmatella erecta]|uniref:Uncharacterized protein n=1 Tax=Stigmatella erecta TaxID=83460 RepID=A0A1I0ISH0_9BACT|nr:hypothetical protein SAMN05443639_106239 [Stigmatella erecta]